METPKIRVNEKNRVVRAYKEDMEDDVIFNKIEKYKKLGYKPIITDRPKKNRHHLKDDMITYLKGHIDDDLYNTFIDRLDKKHKFLIVRWWLEKELKDRAEKNNKSYEPIIDIINKVKSQKAREESTKNEEKEEDESKIEPEEPQNGKDGTKKNKDKNAVNEDK